MFFTVMFLSNWMCLLCHKITRLEDSSWHDQVHRALTSSNFIRMFESVPTCFRKKWKDWNYVEGQPNILVGDIYVIKSSMISHHI